MRKKIALFLLVFTAAGFGTTQTQAATSSTTSDVTNVSRPTTINRAAAGKVQNVDSTNKTFSIKFGNQTFAIDASSATMIKPSRKTTASFSDIKNDGFVLVQGSASRDSKGRFNSIKAATIMVFVK